MSGQEKQIEKCIRSPVTTFLSPSHSLYDTRILFHPLDCLPFYLLTKLSRLWLLRTHKSGQMTIKYRNRWQNAIEREEKTANVIVQLNSLSNWIDFWLVKSTYWFRSGHITCVLVPLLSFSYLFALFTRCFGCHFMENKSGKSLLVPCNGFFITIFGTTPSLCIYIVYYILPLLVPIHFKHSNKPSMCANKTNHFSGALSSVHLLSAHPLCPDRSHVRWAWNMTGHFPTLAHTTIEYRVLLNSNPN